MMKLNMFLIDDKPVAPTGENTHYVKNKLEKWERANRLT